MSARIDYESGAGYGEWMSTDQAYGELSEDQQTQVEDAASDLVATEGMDWMSAIGLVVKAVYQYKMDDRLFDLNVERVRRGLDPVSGIYTSTEAATRAGVINQNLMLAIVGGVAVIGRAIALSGRRR